MGADVSCLRIVGGDERGVGERALPARGRAVWVTAGLFGYIEAEGEAVLLEERESGAQMRLTPGDVRAVFPAARLAFIELGSGGGRLFILVDGGTAGSALLSLSAEDRQLTLLAVLPPVRFGVPAVSPSGRWVNLVQAESNGETASQTYAVEVESRRVITVERDPENGERFAWSADERWLLFLENGLLRLTAPEQGETFLIAPPHPGCLAPHWVLTPAPGEVPPGEE